LDTADALEDLKKQVDELMIDFLDEQSEKYDKLNEKLEHHISMLEAYYNVSDLLGAWSGAESLKPEIL
jgi:prefoldin subunit 5